MSHQAENCFRASGQVVALALRTTNSGEDLEVTKRLSKQQRREAEADLILSKGRELFGDPMGRQNREQFEAKPESSVPKTCAAKRNVAAEQRASAAISGAI